MSTKKKAVKTPPGPPTWTEEPQIPPEILKKVEEQMAKQAKKPSPKKGQH